MQMTMPPAISAKRVFWTGQSQTVRLEHFYVVFGELQWTFGLVRWHFDHQDFQERNVLKNNLHLHEDQRKGTNIQTVLVHVLFVFYANRRTAEKHVLF